MAGLATRGFVLFSILAYPERGIDHQRKVAKKIPKQAERRSMSSRPAPLCLLGKDYGDYRQQVGMLTPRMRKRAL